MESATEAARKAKTSFSEAEAFLNFQRAFTINEKLDSLITQSSKRLNSILSQIAMHRISLAEALRRRLEIEEREVEMEYKKMELRKEEELQQLAQENTQKRLEQDRQEKQARRQQAIEQMQQQVNKAEANAKQTTKLAN